MSCVLLFCVCVTGRLGLFQNDEAPCLIVLLLVTSRMFIIVIKASRFEYWIQSALWVHQSVILARKVPLSVTFFQVTRIPCVYTAYTRGVHRNMSESYLAVAVFRETCNGCVPETAAAYGVWPTIPLQVGLVSYQTSSEDALELLDSSCLCRRLK
jgi:hypothetical protein